MEGSFVKYENYFRILFFMSLANDIIIFILKQAGH